MVSGLELAAKLSKHSSESMALADNASNNKGMDKDIVFAIFTFKPFVLSS